MIIMKKSISFFCFELNIKNFNLSYRILFNYFGRELRMREEKLRVMNLKEFIKQKSLFLVRVISFNSDGNF